jgi:hypothetical protein
MKLDKQYDASALEIGATLNTKNWARLSTIEDFQSSGGYEWGYCIAKLDGGIHHGEYIVTIYDDYSEFDHNNAFDHNHRIACDNLDQARKLCTLIAIAIDGTAISIKEVLRWAREIGLIADTGVNS